MGSIGGLQDTVACKEKALEAQIKALQANGEEPVLGQVHH